MGNVRDCQVPIRMYVQHRAEGSAAAHIVFGRGLVMGGLTCESVLEGRAGPYGGGWKVTEE